MKKRILIPILVCVFVTSLLCACSKDINFTFPKYNVNKTPTKEDPLVKDEGAVVDGVLDEPFWQDAQKTAFTITSKVSDDVTMTTMTYVSDFGVYFGIVVNDYAVYYNPERAASRNTSVELYVRGFGNSETETYNLRLAPTGVDGEIQKESRSWRLTTVNGKPEFRQWVYLWEGASVVKGNINTSLCEGYVAEAFIPWSTLGVGNCGYVRYMPAFNHVETESASSAERTWTGTTGCNIKSPDTYKVVCNEGVVDLDGRQPTILNAPAIHLSDALRKDGVYTAKVAATSNFGANGLNNEQSAVDATWNVPDGVTVTKNADNTVNISVPADKITQFVDGAEYSVTYLGVTQKGEILYAPVTLDGEADNNYGPSVSRSTLNGASQTTRAKIARKGVYIMVEVTDSNIQVNTHTETYFMFGDKCKIGNSWQIRYYPYSDTYKTYAYNTPNSQGYAWTELTGKAKLGVNLVGKITDKGYNVEIYIPYSVLSFTTAPESVNVLSCYGYYPQGATSVSNMDGDTRIGNKYVWNVANYLPFGANGYIRKSVKLDNVVLTEDDLKDGFYVKDFAVTDDENNLLEVSEFTFLTKYITALDNGMYRISVPQADRSKFASPRGELIVVDGEEYVLNFEIFAPDTADVFVSYDNGTLTNSGTKTTAKVSSVKLNAERNSTAFSDVSLADVRFTTGVDGKENGAIVTNNRNGAYTLIDGVTTGVSDFTVSIWLKIDASTVISTGNSTMLFGTTGVDGINKGNGFYLTMRKGASYSLQFSYGGDPRTTVDEKTKTLPFAAGEWNLITFVRNGTNITIYLNARKVYTATLAEEVNLGGSKLAFGGFFGDSFLYTDTDLMFDNVCFFGRALGENNIKVMYEMYNK